MIDHELTQAVTDRFPQHDWDVELRGDYYFVTLLRLPPLFDITMRFPDLSAADSSLREMVRISAQQCLDEAERQRTGQRTAEREARGLYPNMLGGKDNDA